MTQQRKSYEILKEMRALSAPSQDQLYQWNLPVQNLVKDIEKELKDIDLEQATLLNEFVSAKFAEADRFKSLFSIFMEHPTDSSKEVILVDSIIGRKGHQYRIRVHATGGGLRIYLTPISE